MYLYLSTPELPPNRNIYYKFKYYSKKQKPNSNLLVDENYFWKNTFYFNDTKSGRKYQIRLRKSAMKCTRLIEEYHKKFNKTEWLLIHPEKHTQLTNLEMTNFMKKMTEPSGKSNSSRMLRTIYVSEVVSMMPLKQRVETCRRMDHSLVTQLTYYEKTN